MSPAPPFLSLGACGYQVRAASDGQQGLEAVLHEEADLVLLDLMLPKLDGYEICRRAREQALPLPTRSVDRCLTTRGARLSRTRETHGSFTILRDIGYRFEAEEEEAGL